VTPTVRRCIVHVEGRFVTRARHAEYIARACVRGHQIGVPPDVLGVNAIPVRAVGPVYGAAEMPGAAQEPGSGARLRMLVCSSEGVADVPPMVTSYSSAAGGVCAGIVPYTTCKL